MKPLASTHPALSSPHGFFGRQGGVSEGVYAALNAGQRSDDNPDHVIINRARITEWLGAETVVSLAQIHSTDIVFIDTAPDHIIEADGLVTMTPGLAVSALSADCVPVLFEDVEAGIVAACHAGWRGALSGIAESTVAAMGELGAHPARIKAVLGPCISQSNYEVGEAFKAIFTEVSDDYAQFFSLGPTGTPHFDLPGFILSRLGACGVENRHWTGRCTYADETHYFSYRRNTHQGLNGYGRNLSAIMRPH